jgi:L-lactate dehydrogenase
MVRAVLHDEKRIMPASMLLEGEYGEENVFAGVPCVIGKNGVEEVIELPLTAEEKAKFNICCEDIRKHIKEAEAIEAVK